MQSLPWIVALVALVLLGAVLIAWAMRSRGPKKPPPLPTEWALTARPVFSTDERRVYRLLREALPHHIVLSKLPLVRFCQPNEPDRGPLLVRTARRPPRYLRHLQPERPGPGRDRPRHRPQQFAPDPADQAIGARRVPCALSALPGRQPARRVAELQLLVPSSAGPARGPQPPAAAPHDIHAARDILCDDGRHAGAPSARRSGRTPTFSRTPSSLPTTGPMVSAAASSRPCRATPSQRGALTSNGHAVRLSLAGTGPRRYGWCRRRSVEVFVPFAALTIRARGEPRTPRRVASPHDQRLAASCPTLCRPRPPASCSMPSTASACAATAD